MLKIFKLIGKATVVIVFGFVLFTFTFDGFDINSKMEWIIGILAFLLLLNLIPEKQIKNPKEKE